MKQLSHMILMILIAAVFLGTSVRDERQASIVPECEVKTYPADLLDWIEPAEYLAKTIWGEARGLDRTQQAAVAWCVLNRVDAGWGTIVECVTEPYQFSGYFYANPVEPELLDLALDVISRWQSEKNNPAGYTGRVLPKEYLFFTSWGGVNVYQLHYGNYGITYDWSLKSPYEQ